MDRKTHIIRFAIIGVAVITTMATSRVDSARDFVNFSFESGDGLCECYSISETPSAKSHYATNVSEYPIEITIRYRTDEEKQTRLVLEPKSKTFLGCTEEKSKQDQCVRTYRSLQEANYVWMDGTRSLRQQTPSR